jgi:hypothetical protein
MVPNRWFALSGWDVVYDRGDSIIVQAWQILRAHRSNIPVRRPRKNLLGLQHSDERLYLFRQTRVG